MLEDAIVFKNNIASIDTKALANGVYFINLKQTNSFKALTLSKRFIIAR